VGLLNGAVYFILLTLLIYSAGYFTTEAASGAGDPTGARLLTETRAQLHELNLDRVLATYDMVPAQVYQTADIATLVLHNPPLLSRLGQYPPCLQLADRPEYKNLAHDEALQQMIESQAKVLDIIQYPIVHAMLTNGVIVAQLSGLMGRDLDDLQTFLATGQSPKYDPETILGVWDIDRSATFAQVRKKEPKILPKVLAQKEQDLLPLMQGLILSATLDNQMILKRPNADRSKLTVVAAGTWKKDQDTYDVTLPGSLPETSEIEIEGGNRLFLPKFGYVLVFDKQL
jgi:hypothetical protein